MLNISIPNYCINEQKYIIDVILQEFLGLSYKIKIHNNNKIFISNDNTSKKIMLDASFFIKAHNLWLDNASMPETPLNIWQASKEGYDLNLVRNEIPILYGKPGIISSKDSININFDIFGSAFFMLSRYEELLSGNYDNHERFPAIESLAYQEGFLDRPIINEYLEVLKYCLISLWPELNLIKRSSKNFITCDVDWPYDPSLYSLKYLVKKIIRLIFIDKNIASALKRIFLYSKNKFYKQKQDSYYDGIKFIMDMNETFGNKVAFYFISHYTSKLDTLKDSEFDSIRIRSLMKEINNRGHEIGVHPGYNTFNNSGNFKNTVERLRKILKEEKIDQKYIGGRQHFLRWDVSQTPKLWEANNLLYDSTLSYADNAGFRCGICYEYSMYDLIERRALHLKQRPLIAMESSIISKNYEGLGYGKKSMKRFEHLKNTCHQFNGTFALLWHNSHFQNNEDKIFYERLIK